MYQYVEHNQRETKTGQRMPSTLQPTYIRRLPYCCCNHAGTHIISQAQEKMTQFVIYPALAIFNVNENAHQIVIVNL